MSLPEVTPDQILNAMQHVPTGRWSEALRAIENLQDSSSSTATPPAAVKDGVDLRDSGLIGLWADREDITNNHEFARELRREAEQRK